MSGHARKFIVTGLAGIQLLLAQAIRTGWQEWPFPESLQDPPISPIHLAANKFRDLYVVDGDNNRIVLIPGDGSEPRTAGGWGHRGDLFSFPTDIEASPGLDVLVCDNAAHRILMFDRKLNYVGERVLTGLVSNPAEYPYKIAQNHLGELVVVTSVDWQVNLISQDGRLMATMGDVAYGRGRFGEISDLTLDSGDRIGLVDVSAGVMVVLTRAGDVKKRVLLPEPGSRLVEWWDDRWLVLGSSGELYELSASDREFRLIPSQLREKPDLVPRDFVVVDDVVYVAGETSGMLYRATLRTLED